MWPARRAEAEAEPRVRAAALRLSPLCPLNCPVEVSRERPEMGRGLHNFIRDLKNASSPEKEQKRVAEELAKIRAKFRGGKDLDAYGKKKYVTKLLYIFMLGYDVDFGVIESVHLLAMPGFAEKSCGYLAVSLLLDEHHEMMHLVINSVRNDLQLSMEALAGENQCLALGLLSNLGAGPFMEELCPHVKRLLVTAGVEGYVKKRAALCLVHMNRKSNEYMDGAEMCKPVLSLLESNDIGLCTSVMSLLLSMVATSAEGWEEAPGAIVTLLAKVRRNERNYAAGYTYFQIPSPWLQIKCMRLLQYFPPSDNEHVSTMLDKELTAIVTDQDIDKKNHNKINALHSIFFEAVHLVNHMRAHYEAAGSPAGDGMTALLLKAIDHLGLFLIAESNVHQNKNLKLCNVQYLALDTLSRIAVVPGSAQHLKKYTDAFIRSLEDEDMGIRRRALDVLYEMAERATAGRIVSVHSNAHGRHSNRRTLRPCTGSVREGRQVAGIPDGRGGRCAGGAGAEGRDPGRAMGDQVRLVRRRDPAADPGGRPDGQRRHLAPGCVHRHQQRALQPRAAQVRRREGLRSRQAGERKREHGQDRGGDPQPPAPCFFFPPRLPAVFRRCPNCGFCGWVSPLLLKRVRGGPQYLLGEFGHHIGEEAGSSYADQFKVLAGKFGAAAITTKAILLNTFMKFRTTDPTLAPQVDAVLKTLVGHVDQEVQQRACEYLMFAANAPAELTGRVFDAMDFYPDRDNPLVKRLLESNAAGAAGAESSHVTAKQFEKAKLAEQLAAGGGSNLGGGSGGPATVGQPEPERPAAAQAGDGGGGAAADVADLLGLGGSTPSPRGGGGGAAAAAAAVGGPPPSPRGAVVEVPAEKALALGLKSKGRIYREDGLLEIGFVLPEGGMVRPALPRPPPPRATCNTWRPAPTIFLFFKKNTRPRCACADG